MSSMSRQRLSRSSAKVDNSSRRAPVRHLFQRGRHLRPPGHVETACARWANFAGSGRRLRKLLALWSGSGNSWNDRLGQPALALDLPDRAEPKLSHLAELNLARRIQPAIPSRINRMAHFSILMQPPFAGRLRSSWNHEDCSPPADLAELPTPPPYLSRLYILRRLGYLTMLAWRPFSLVGQSRRNIDRSKHWLSTRALTKDSTRSKR